MQLRLKKMHDFCASSVCYHLESGESNDGGQLEGSLRNGGVQGGCGKALGAERIFAVFESRSMPDSTSLLLLLLLLLLLQGGRKSKGHGHKRTKL